MGVRHYAVLGYAKAGIDQFRIRPEYVPESPEPLISGDLGSAIIKRAEILHDDSLLPYLGLRKSWAQSVLCPARIWKPKCLIITDKRLSPYIRPQKNWNFCIVIDLLLRFLWLIKSRARSVPYPTRIRKPKSPIITLLISDYHPTFATKNAKHFA